MLIYQCSNNECRDLWISIRRIFDKNPLNPLNPLNPSNPSNPTNPTNNDDQKTENINSDNSDSDIENDDNNIYPQEFLLYRHIYGSWMTNVAGINVPNLLKNYHKSYLSYGLKDLIEGISLNTICEIDLDEYYD